MCLSAQVSGRQKLHARLCTLDAGTPDMLTNANKFIKACTVTSQYLPFSNTKNFPAKFSFLCLSLETCFAVFRFAFICDLLLPKEKKLEIPVEYRFLFPYPLVWHSVCFRMLANIFPVLHNYVFFLSDVLTVTVVIVVIVVIVVLIVVFHLFLFLKVLHVFVT
jgi:hypothetical protein